MIFSSFQEKNGGRGLEKKVTKFLQKIEVHGPDMLSLKMAEDPSEVKGRIRVNKVADFSWSFQLWQDAAHGMLKVVFTLLTIFVVVTVGLCYFDGVKGVSIPYLISASISTVGLGDIAPSTQFSRACCIFVLPFELVVIGGYLLSFLSFFTINLCDIFMGKRLNVLRYMVRISHRAGKVTGKSCGKSTSSSGCYRQ